MRLLFLGLLTTLSACEEKACTLIGCVDGLRLIIEDGNGNPFSGVSGTIVIDGDTDNAIEFDCGATESGEGYTCFDNEILFEVREGSSAEYSINADERITEGVLTLDFEESRPNGEDCDPVCYNDEHTIIFEDIPVEPG